MYKIKEQKLIFLLGLIVLETRNQFDLVFLPYKPDVITNYCSFKLGWPLKCAEDKKKSFRSKKETFYKPCIAMFYYSSKAVSYRTFKAITRAGLVFDGGIVINANYETNDPFIYAAGTITKYSRKYYAEHLAHRYFNLEEVGFDLGVKAKNKFIYNFGVQYDIDKGAIIKCEDYKTVRVFEKPLLTYCKLPGGLWYLNVSKPGRKINPEIMKALNQYGQDLVTGNCSSLENQGYFKIHLNVHDTVESITCLSLSDIDKNNLFSLWGKHEKILNKLLTRYEMGLIKDLFEYFRQPWAAALYEDDFTELYNNIYSIMHEKPSYVIKKTLTEHIIESHTANNWKKFNDDMRDEIDELFMNTEYPKLIEREVAKYIVKHGSTLPMYFNEVEDALQKRSSPLFDP